MAAHMAATQGMSVIVWCARKYQSGIVARMAVPRSPARRPKTLATPLYRKYMARIVISTMGVRTTHSGCAV